MAFPHVYYATAVHVYLKKKFKFRESQKRYDCFQICTHAESRINKYGI